MYDYQTERPKLFTEEGQIQFLKLRDRAQELLQTAGAFDFIAVTRGVTGDSWFMLACLDRLVEIGELRELTPEGVAGQHRVFVQGRGKA